MDIFNLSQEEKERLKVYSISKNHITFNAKDIYLHVGRARWMSEEQNNLLPEGVPTIKEGIQIPDFRINPARLSIEQIPLLIKWLSQLPNIKLDSNEL